MSSLFGFGWLWDRSTPIPTVKLKRVSLLVAILIGLVGWALASYLGDSLWFQRFGSLVVLSAALFAYFGQLSADDIEAWAKASMEKIELNAQLVLQTDYREDALDTMPATMTDADYLVIQSATGLTGNRTARGSWSLMTSLAGNPQHSDGLAQYLNRRLIAREIIIGTAGTLVWGFGDLVHAWV